MRMAVRRVKGILSAGGDAKEQTMTVRFDPEVASGETIKQAMARIGYETQEM